MDIGLDDDKVPVITCLKAYLFFILVLTFSLNGFSQIEETKFLKEGKNLFEKGNYKAALTKFIKESEINESCDVFLWIASCYIKLQRISDAKKQFHQILNKSCSHQENIEAIINLGNCYNILNTKDSAMYYYNMAIETSHKSSPSAYFNKALLLHKMSLFEEAKENYNKAILLDPLNWLYYMKRQEVSFILKDFEAAIQDMSKAKSLNADADITMNMAYAYSMMEKFQQADSIYQTIYNEKDDLFLNNYGFNKHKLGKTKEGIILIEKSLSLNPKNSYAHRNLGIIVIDNKEFSKACYHLNEAKKLGFAAEYGSEVEELLVKYCQ